MGSSRWRTVAPAAMAVALLAAACGTGGPAAEEEADPTNAAASATATPSTGGGEGGSGEGDGSGVADPEHAVDPPGPRTGAALGDDILIYSPDPIPADVVEQVESLDGVLASSQFSMLNIETDNKVLTVAAVDPATYRNFTPTESADFQEQWDRVAGGEISVVPTEKKKLPLDDDGYLEVGSGDQTEAIHVGSFAPQVGDIDAVVNTAWVADLGMPEGNAMVLQTGSTAPQTLRKPLEEIVGETASVQALDAVAQYGLDPKAKLLAVFAGSFADAVGTYNYTVSGGQVVPASSWVKSHIETREMPIIGSMTCNRYMFPQLEAALQEIQAAGLADTIYPDQYAGCYYPRFIAGSTTLSNHSFGLAFDINVPGNLRGTAGELDRGVVAIFKKWGFAWGGDWSYTDPMHFELDRIVRPGGAG